MEFVRSIASIHLPVCVLLATASMRGEALVKGAGRPTKALERTLRWATGPARDTERAEEALLAMLEAAGVFAESIILRDDLCRNKSQVEV